ncbi:MAG: DNA glycosylase family protein, partial [Planctomycetota bacterium]
MATARLRLRAPDDFSLSATLRSHGWSDLPPFAVDGDRLTIRLGGADATVVQAGRDLHVTLRSERPLGSRPRDALAAAVRSCLRFDLDLEEFWSLCREDRDLVWADRLKAGRFLRAPTAFADAAMILATTNCSWALTRRMVGALVEGWGTRGAFPTQGRLAEVSASELRARASVGYRAPYLAALARGPDLESLRTDRSTTAELRRRLCGLKGFGPYAAENMLRLLGDHFEHFALDSWTVQRWKELYPRRKAAAPSIERRLH